jgi:hypothetical protein
VTPSAISQAVRALEARVGAALFIRTTRSVGLTEAGERFLSRAKPAFEELVAASEVARELGQRPAGLLRLSVPRAVVPILLEPLIASFAKAYPTMVAFSFQALAHASVCEFDLQAYSEYGRCKNTEEEDSKVQEYSENVPAVFRDLCRLCFVIKVSNAPGLGAMNSLGAQTASA